MGDVFNRKLVNRRPLFFAALLLCAGIFLGCSVRAPLAVLIAALSASSLASLLFFFAGRIKRAKDTPSFRRFKALSSCFACCAVFFLGALLIAGQLAFPLLDVDSQKEFTFSGRVCETPVKTDYGYTHIIADTWVIEGGGVRRMQGKVRFVSENEYPYGSILKITAPLKLPRVMVNPGGYDERLNLNRRGIYYKAYADAANVIGKSPQDLYGFLLGVKEDIREVVRDIFPEDVRGLALGMLLGDTQELPEETYEDFKTAGASHILAVSGLNVAIIIFVFYRFLKLLRIGKKPRYFATLLFIAFYAALTGLGPSIVRASVMAVLFLSVNFFGQKTDMPIVLSASAVCILLYNPLELFMPGFQLTFFAVFGMVTLGDALSRRLCKWPKGLRELLSANIGATAGTAPVLLCRFYSVSVVSVAGNFAIVPLSTLATVLITVVVPLGAFSRELAYLPAIAATSMMRLIGDIVHVLARIPFASVTPGALHAAFLPAVFVWLFSVSRYFLIKPKVKKVIALALAVLIAAAAVFSYIPWRQDLYVAFLDVGQGDAAFVRTPGRTEFLIDGGDEWADDDIAAFLDYKGARLDFAFLTHPHDDHAGGIADLIRQGRIHTVYTTKTVRDAMGEALRGAHVCVLKKGDRLEPEEGLTIEVLHPPDDAKKRNLNDTSLTLLIRYRGRSLLFTGDISAKVDETLLDEIKKTDMIKVAHHGTDTSTSEALLKRALPDYAVISVGNNAYGQPGKEAIKRLYRYGGRVFRTDKNHAVEFSIGDTVRAMPMYE